ncbi:P-loop containing nucleoside triphosphate hydrolase protein [Umbelopsis sp. AD052]|nr:P-loop containing nucleoside triphosphate hydrolase protein [Umbelopsis sp. AD052]
MSFLWNLGTAKKPVASAKPASPPHFQSMNVAFRRGVQYNMKVAIRGDVMTGKSTLFRRLQGADFDSNYISTPQIEVSNIQWKYKDSPDIIKVEVWDVVDRAKNAVTSPSTETGIKLEHTSAQKQQPKRGTTPPTAELGDLGLDASTVNVYRNCHGVIFMFDMTKPWTFEYVIKELPSVPGNISILVLGNFNDKDLNERKVSLDTVHAALYDLNQERIKEKDATKPNLIRYIECSMSTGSGLRYIYAYLGIPFLQLQIESMRQQLETKAIEAVDLLDELDQSNEVPEQLQRIRGQDNFQQPSTSTLDEQRSTMRDAWEAELDQIARDHEPEFDMPPSHTVKSKTPTPPMSPVRVERVRPLRTKEDVPAAIDYFNAGTIDTDFFQEEAPESKPQHIRSVKKHIDSDDEWTGNPIVASDEDLEDMEYYGAEGDVTSKTAAANEVDEEDDYQEPVKFKSSLLQVWDDPTVAPVVTSQGIVSQHNAAFAGSDSEDEADTSYDGGVSGTAGDYEEIGGGDNPWSFEPTRSGSPDFSSPPQVKIRASYINLKKPG